MGNETTETALYLLHKKVNAPSRSYPNLTPDNTARIAKRINPNDQQLTELIRKRNYYTQKVYKYLNDLGDKNKGDEKDELQQEENQNQQTKITTSNINLSNTTPNTISNIQVGNQIGKPFDKPFDKPFNKPLDKPFNKPCFTLTNVLSDMNKRAEIALYVEDQKARQFQWQVQREEIVSEYEEKIGQYSSNAMRQMEKYHPLKLEAKKAEMDGELEKMEEIMKEELVKFDENVYNMCLEINERTSRRLKNLGVEVTKEVLVQIESEFC